MAAMYANTNMDDPENNREQRVRQLQDYYRALRREVLGESLAEVPEAPDPQAEAFFRASKRNQAMFDAPEMPGEASISRLQ